MTRSRNSAVPWSRPLISKSFVAAAFAAAMLNLDKVFHDVHASATHTDGLLQIGSDLDIEKAGSSHINALSNSDSAHLSEAEVQLGLPAATRRAGSGRSCGAGSRCPLISTERLTAGTRNDARHHGADG
jgi:hypothetical protein